jgi:threonylcarbamoyladenosine tRNA methylthiotransferase MtaB
MRELGQQKRLEFYGQFTGRSLPVLIETKRDGSTGLLKGISSNYLPVLIDGGDDLQNKIVTVKIENLQENRLYGVLGI